MKNTITNNFFYHIYPLGLCGAPSTNDFSCTSTTRLLSLIDQIPHLQNIGVSAVYLGPLFESTAHGYDTVDYYQVDRRLGKNEDLTTLVHAYHQSGISVVLDGVFNHTGRQFFAFRDLQEKGYASPYRDWFLNVDFNRRSPAGDNFWYEGWSGHYDLVKLNTSNTEVREHLFGAVQFWIEEFGIDGIRLDAADVLAPDFMDALSSFCRSLKTDFWLLGEVVHGDYRNWACEGRLDSVTNYEVHKGLWSSLNDQNFFEIAHSINRQSGPQGLYKHLSLYNFADNHDVNRVASVLKKQAHLFPLYGLLFTIPGIPSVYYGSEWALRGEKKNGSDWELRPSFDPKSYSLPHNIPDVCRPTVDPIALENAIRTFAQIRKEHPALQQGEYRQIHVASEQFVFIRQTEKEHIIVAVNSSASAVSLCIPTQGFAPDNQTWRDALEQKANFQSNNGKIQLQVPSSWLRILVMTTE